VLWGVKKNSKSFSKGEVRIVSMARIGKKGRTLKMMGRETARVLYALTSEGEIIKGLKIYQPIAGVKLEEREHVSLKL